MKRSFALLVVVGNAQWTVQQEYRAVGTPVGETPLWRKNRSARTAPGGEGRGGARHVNVHQVTGGRGPAQRRGGGGVGWLRPPMRAGDGHTSFHAPLVT